MFPHHLTNHSALRRHGKWGSSRPVGRLRGRRAGRLLGGRAAGPASERAFPGRLRASALPANPSWYCHHPPRLSPPLGPGSSGSYSTLARRVPALLCAHSLMDQGRGSGVLANSPVKPPGLAVTASGSFASRARWPHLPPPPHVGVEPVSHHSTPCHRHPTLSS